MRRISIDYRRTRTTTLDFYTALQHATAQTLPRVVALVLTAEVAAFYYGFLVWRKRKPRLNEFSYHRTSGSTVILITIMFLVVAETVVIHLLLMRWSPTIAVVLTAVSAYTVVQLLGLIRAIRQRPITVDDNYLTLRYGFLQEATVPMSSIASITEIRGLNKREGEQILSLSPLGALETPNVLIRLSRPAVMQTMYGSRKAFATISFYVDEPEQLRSSIDPVRSAI